MSRLYSNPNKVPGDSESLLNPQAEIQLPVTAEVLRLRISNELKSEQPLFQFGNSPVQYVELTERFETSTLNAGVISADGLLTLVMIPQPMGLEANKLVQHVHAWIEATVSPQAALRNTIASILVTLQGVQILWQLDRVIVFADDLRMEPVCRAIVEATFYEQNLFSIEQAVDAGWARTQVDSAFAFQFGERELAAKDALAARFQEVLSLRIRLARLTPQILVPHVYPPTLASQIGERLRERIRMSERLELVDEKLATQERVYDHCTQRAGEYVVARTGHLLEWAIIGLLLLQTLLLIVDFLGSMGQ